MPETIRTANGGQRSCPRRGGFLAAFVTVALIGAIAPAVARADGFSPIAFIFPALTQDQIATIALILGLVCFGLLATLVLVRTRRTASETERHALEERSALRAECDRLRALLTAEPQVLLAWQAGTDIPDIVGDAGLIIEGPPQRILAFGAWLDAPSAQEVEHALDGLRADGRAFVMTLTTRSGRPVEAEGRAIGGIAILRLRDVGGLERELLDLENRHAQLQQDAQVLRGLLDALPAPVWARNADGRLVFVNSAYARALEAADSGDAIARELELLDRTSRKDVMEARAQDVVYSGRVPAVAKGARRIFDVIDCPSASGSAGIAIDRTEAEDMRAELGRMIEAHRRVLDHLATGVAVFNVDRKLTFYNNAFRSVFDLNAAFLDSGPTDGAVLERLRAEHNLPEQQDFKQWKHQLYEAYQAIEPREHEWHLPDGRTLRVVTTPNPEGGVTYLYDDVTERLDMHRRFDALIKVQSETLDNLAEAVAVFGSDGRIRLHNPAFQRMWKVTPEALDQHPHVEAVAAWCQAQHDATAVWRNLRAAATAIDGREPISARVERRDGMVIDMASIPLPDGATLVTFLDVTDSVNVERVLRESNEALVAADAIKINFVHHVSYELRSPLTNIIGFAHFLGDPAFGPLTDKQREYLGYITTSTNALLAIINNILDLATIDAGAMKLEVGVVDIRASMDAAAEGVQDRLVNNKLTLSIHATPGIGSFRADERRLRQVLFNLLSNAVGFSPAGETVTLTAERRAGAVVFSVSDHGPGIPPEAKDKLFEWFESDPRGSQHRGPGLGLALVRSFVELHGGSVSIDSELGRGTTVTCVFPDDAHELSKSAA
jgi:signal transduction histidine kinase